MREKWQLGIVEMADNRDKQLQKALLDMRDEELLQTYCHEGFRIYEIFHGKQVWIGVCSFNFTIPNKTKVIDSSRKKVLLYIFVLKLN